MSEIIDKYLAEKKPVQALQECLNSNQIYLGIFLGKIYETIPECKAFLSQFEKRGKDIGKLIRVKLLCNWCSSEELVKIWNKMSKGNCTWNNITIVSSDPADYYVIINKPLENAVYDKKRTIVFQMEPHMNRNVGQWKEWADPDGKEFLKVCKHREGEYNNNEWHLSKTYSQLCNENIVKNPEYNNVLSTVLSANYRDPGHVKRIDFVKFLEQKMPVHMYGDNKWEYKEYKGSLPYHCKDDAIFPYKYTFNAENNDAPYYYTEKLIDGILGECLTFYWGCPNIRELIDPRAYIELDLSNFAKDYEIVKKAIEEDWHSKRLPYIREAKKKILNDLQFFPRLERILNQEMRLQPTE
jgi:hypothetical protein